MILHISPVEKEK